MRRDDHTRSRRILSTTLLVLVALVSGCNWLSGPKLDTDPNRSVSASRDQLFIGVQRSQFETQPTTLEAQLTVSLWMQQLTAVGQFYQSIQVYQDVRGDFTWGQSYAHGGLVDVRKIEASARDAHDRTYLGIAQVWEALIISQVADMFGDIPYSEAAANIANPKLDSQAVVYGALQLLLDSAVTNLASLEGEGPPVSLDLVYGDNTAEWIEAAHSLKARLFLHTAERNPSAYGEALGEAELGISSAAGDLLSWHSENPSERNPWFDLSVAGGSTEIVAGKVIVDMMKARNDPRLQDYFSIAGNGQYLGAAPGAAFDEHVQSRISATRGAMAFHQPILTWAETRLIAAEAQFRVGHENEARGALNVERASVGLPPVNAAGSALLIEILQEKYIALFQNPEVWNDYKRTCYPNLAPVTQAQGGNIPPRYLYDEFGVNPNIPPDPARNWNDPVTAFAPDGSPCLGQR